jgi:uncharacterized protein
VATKATTNDARAATPLGEIARGVAWLVGTAIAVRLVETLIGRSPLGAALAGAVVVDLAMTRAGVRWDDDEPRAKSSKSKVWRNIGIGVAIACVLVFVPLALGVIVGAASVRPGTVSSTLLFGLLRSGADGVRAELLYRGLPLLVAARTNIREPLAIGYAAVAGTTPLLLMEHLPWEALLVALARGTLFAMLWVRTNSAWASVSAHAAWIFLAGVGMRGALVEASWTSGLLAENARIRGLPAIVCIVVTILLTVFVSRKLAKSLEAPHGHVAS